MSGTQKIQHLMEFSQPDQQHGFALKLMELLVIPTFVIDIHGKVIIWNLACERLTGVPAWEVLGTSDHWKPFYQEQRPTLADLVIEGRSAELHRLYRQHARRNDSDNNLCAENWCDMPRIGRRRYLAADASPIFDNDGKLVAVVETLRDVTDEKRAQVALEQLATRDGLTGLANRRCFDDTLNAEWQRALRQQQPLSLLMVDVDNFKQYNDAYGHLGGDECLQRIATAVSSEMRANDLVARYGGEEFAVILPNQSLKGAAIVAERIRCRVEQLRLPNLGSKQHVVTVSIGAATALAAPENDPSQLVATADSALYRAKHMGRNRISLPGAE
ncbi:PAS domain S-box-containing protein/diguanylate cyclase (GGDEF) domain-containing protein [Duganella sp. CF402]|uniref:sensor domain-containing diguanylate cyclase n=1 Tax=unclassified Duganella TaxID=2636909 RepID=UPI0008C0DF9F|nr:MULTISPECIES: diguanylate cyclase [unclassified Duganella]RZT10413.1 PAS domain S-box-containing protein/diguanylate cyclase (GGDEF)-like protein [Duganella sp. BK701]SEL14146.1 PAS domain S-box-containing protein/diguanylate cyclase (GGDEF) domain-containing protein [Duganella sp. CF402]